MILRRLSIRARIALPFTALSVAVTVGTAFLAVSVVSSALEARLARQMVRASEVLSEGGLAVNPAALQRLKPIIEADIVTYSASGEVVASTLDRGAAGEIERLVIGAAPGGELFSLSQPVVVRELGHAGRRYKVAYRPLREPPDTAVAFLADTSEIEEATATIARAIAMVAGVIILLTAVLSQLIARGITLPLQHLVGVTRQLSAGDLGHRAVVPGPGEIGTLARAFNEMAERLRESEEKLVRSERLAAAGRIAAGIAHDIRNPLSSIRMQAQLLRVKLEPGPASQEALNAILREIERLEWVVKGLLDLVRPGELQLARTSVNHLVERALRLMESQLAHRKIDVVRHLAADVPDAVADGDRLTQALLNVILNAADAMPAGGTLTVTTRLRPERGSVSIEIADDGEGIDPAVRARLFQPFVTTKRGGVGLGLVNVLNTVERHGGSVELVPREGGGTRAVLTLPLDPAAGPGKPR